MAIWRPLAVARARRRFATLTQPMSRTNATAPIISSSGCRTLPTTVSPRGNEMDAPGTFVRVIRRKLLLQRGNECIELALRGRKREFGFDPCDGCSQYA